VNDIKISVVIPTRKRPRELRAALFSLVEQTMPQSCYEVIIVDNGPSQETAAVAECYRDRIANLRYVEEPEPGLHSARHRGMREACGSLLVYIDDDVEVDPTWLQSVEDGFARHGADLVGGRNLPKWEGVPPGWLLRLWMEKKKDGQSIGYLSILDFGDQMKEIDPLYVWGCNFAIRKKILIECGGFHPDSMPAELLHLRGDGESHVSRFVASHGYRALYVPAACVHHHVPKERMTLDYFRQRAFNQGVSDSFSRFRQAPSVTPPVQRVSFWKSGLRGAAFRIVPSIRLLKREMKDWYLLGVQWHSHRFLTDANVRAWILRDNYLNMSETIYGSSQPSQSGGNYC